MSIHDDARNAKCVAENDIGGFSTGTLQFHPFFEALGGVALVFFPNSLYLDLDSSGFGIVKAR